MKIGSLTTIPMVFRVVVPEFSFYHDDINSSVPIMYEIILTKIFTCTSSITLLFYPKAIRKQKHYCE